MRAATSLCLAIVAVGCAHAPTDSAPASRLGYSAAAFRTQAALEQRFRNGVSAERLSAFHAAVTRRPHMAGTDGARAVADSLQRFLADAGLEVEVLEYSVYLSLPKEIEVELVAPVTKQLRVTEPASSLDPDTNHPELGPGFVAYSAAGDVTASVVYVNYGLPADYAELTARGVSVRGKLALARYGRSHRAVKVHTAEQQGAAGLLIYSDPADDGFARGDTWPTGYWRTAEQLQRGNAKYSWFWHGDPLTPGVPARPAAPRLDPAQAPTLPRIPVAVLSWGEAREILERLDGVAAPPGFQGALPFAYRLGDGAVRVRLHVQMDAGLRTIRNVVARVPGARLAERGVLLGTHHDAWTFGGVDPGTGMAALLELARGLGALRRAGWRPERTISIAFWDAEEFGLIGSTEYAEQRQRELRAGTIAYINTDLYTNGRLDAGGTPSLRDFLIEVTKDVAVAQGNVYDAWRADQWSRQTPERRQRGMDGFEVALKPLGSGADFVPFQDHLGLPTLSIEYNATGGYSYGPYHSNYDTRFFVERVADPGFQRGVELVRLLGTVALRLTQAQVVPFRFSHYAERLAEYVTTASGWAIEGDDRVLFALDLATLHAAVAAMAEQAARLERQIDEGLASGRLPSSATPALNDLIARLEQRLLDESEGPAARWYRHVVYGWNIYSLYDGQPFPGLADAIRLRDGARAQREVEQITAAIDRLREGLAAAAALAAAGRRAGLKASNSSSKFKFKFRVDLMSIAQSMLPEFDQEMATTRRLLERVPSDQGQWKPHPKSFALGHLAQLVAGMPGWLTQTLTSTELDLAKGSGYSFQKTETLLEVFDQNVREARATLNSVKDADLTVPWSLKHGDRVLFTAPRGPVVRTHINHLVHHRGQLSVYLRLLDVPLPSIYGPTADEPWGT